HMSRIARAASLVMALFVISRALGLLREMVVAGQFGTSADMDAYLAAFSLPDFLFYVVAGGALGSAFIPVFAGYLTRNDMPGAWRLASAVINWMVLLLSILAALAAIFAPWLVGWLFGDLSLDQQVLTTELMRLMLISTVIFGVSGTVMGILNAQHHFFLPAAAPIVYNLAIIMGAWFLGPTWGVRGLAVGVVLGAVGHLLIQLPGLFWGNQRMTYHPILAPHNPSLHEVGRLMAPRVLGLAAVQINFIVTRVLAAGLAVGSITALYYGWIIMLLPQGIIAQSVATALFPTLAALAAQGDRAEMRRIFAATLRNLLFLTLPAAVGLIVLARPVVRLLLERGEFTAESTTLTAWALAFFALGLVGHAVVEIAVRAFYALKNTKTPVGIGILAMAVNIGLSILLMRLFALGGLPAHAGLALANSLAVSLEMAILLVLLRPLMGGLSETSLRPSVGKMGVATVGMAVVLLIIEPLLPAEPSWLGGVIGIGVGGLVYIGLAYIIGVDELKPIQYKVTRVLSSIRRS
ncbi:MAG TPA: murein biosynthesis integral membrane protein MurJ, partial [Anaerolineae bacterium]|nr:murein biosynthesis integral membrane protein MurJ [Anaerolineae bacterium]